MQFAVAVFLNSLWEDALLVLAVWALLRNIRVNASTRYFSWLVTLIAAVLLPVATTIPQVTVRSASAMHASRNAGPQILGAATVNKATVQHPARFARQPIAATLASSNSLKPIHWPDRLRLVMPAWVALRLFLTWAALALLIAMRLVLGLYHLERLKREALPLPFELRDQMARWVQAAYGPSREVRICVSDRIEVPVAVGLFDSMILLPSHLLERLSANEIDRISLHELAHLRRGDDWTNSLQRFAQILFFFNPAIRFIGMQLDLEREVACDDWVLALTGEIRPYATCLTKMAELTAWPHHALAAPGVFATRKGISIRIERLLNKHRNAHVKVSYAVPIGVAVALAALFLLANVVTPVIAYAPEPVAVTLRAIATHKQPIPQPKPVVVAVSQPSPMAQPVRTVVHTKTIFHTKTVFHTKTAFHTRTVVVPKIVVHRIDSVKPLPRVAPVRVHAHVGMSSVNVDIPAIQVNVPATHVSVPAVHVRVPAMHLHIRAPGADLNIVAHAGGSCTGCDFDHVNWPGKDLSNRSFEGSSFSHANLAGANFSHAQLSGVDFQGANLTNANFTGASLSGCDLQDANINGARFDHANIAGCTGVNPRQLDQTQLRQWLTQCTGCDFQGANFRNMDLRGLHVSGDDFSRADFRGADLSSSMFSGVDFSRALLSGTQLRGTRFNGCDFSRTDLRSVDLTGASIVGSDLSTAIMR